MRYLTTYKEPECAAGLSLWTFKIAHLFNRRQPERQWTRLLMLMPDEASVIDGFGLGLRKCLLRAGFCDIFTANANDTQVCDRMTPHTTEANKSHPGS